nr:hypothetical protein [Saprospiraceae bacterium]
MFLIFQVSAAGKPKNWNRPASDPFNWPRLVNLAWLHYDKSGQLIKSSNRIIEPGSYQANEEVLSATGLTLEEVTEKGEPLKKVLPEFIEDLRNCEYLFSHNLHLSESVVRSECHRLRINDGPFDYLEKYCIMREATHHCKLAGKEGKYKWPTLQELHQVLFNSRYAKGNNAWSNVVASSTCLFELLKIEAMEL